MKKVSKEPSKINEIDDYLSGNLSPEQVVEFEKILRDEMQVQNDVTLTKKVIDGVEGHAFKKMLKRIHNKHSRRGGGNAED
jgi:hypothetical protein